MARVQRAASESKDLSSNVFRSAGILSAVLLFVPLHLLSQRQAAPILTRNAGYLRFRNPLANPEAPPTAKRHPERRSRAPSAQIGAEGPLFEFIS